jgi:hypothetical protein
MHALPARKPALSAALSLIFAVYCDNDETKRRSKSQGLLIKINLTTDSQ